MEITNEIMTIEQVDKKLAELEKKHSHKIIKEGFTVAFDPATLLASICAVITIAVPILKFVKLTLFFKPAWQKIVQKIIDIAGLVCG